MCLHGHVRQGNFPMYTLLGFGIQDGQDMLVLESFSHFLYHNILHARIVLGLKTLKPVTDMLQSAGLFLKCTLLRPRADLAY